MDFETGDFTGWTLTYGDHPNGVPVISNTINAYNNPCTTFGWPTCPQPGTFSPVGIPLHSTVSGGFDPILGGTLLPRVAPGGNYSVMLGDLNRGGGYAAQLEQTFFVTASNSNFTYQYAAVVHGMLGYHSHSDQAFFRVDVYDSNNNPITCAHSFINPDSVNGFNFFQWSTNPDPAHHTVYWKPWTTVNVDLSNYVNQNVTIKFTTSDCAPGGHFAYAYIDAGCTSIPPLTDTICVGGTKTISAPYDPTFEYFWAPAGETTSTLEITTSGTYTVTITPQQGCPMVRNFNVPFHPNPIASYNITQALCSDSITFHDASVVNNGYINTWKWYVGNNTNDSLINSTSGYRYSSSGIYTATLQVISDKQCIDDTTITILIPEKPKPNFTSDSICEGTITSFNNLTPTITTGSISSYYWSFGNPPSGTQNNSSIVDPQHLYSSGGVYQVQLIAETNYGCIDSVTKSVLVNYLPTVSFSVNSNCVYSSITIVNNSTISAGNISQWNWQFGDGQTSNLQQPSHSYMNDGIYMLTLTAISNEGCLATATNSVSIAGKVFVDFTTSDTAACGELCVTLTNTSSVNNATITNWLWLYSDGSSDTSQHTNKCFYSSGLHSATLIATTDKNCSVQIEKNNFLEVYSVPDADYYTNTEVTTTLDPLIVFYNNSAKADNYIWSLIPNDTFSTNSQTPFNYTYNDTGTYHTQLIATTLNGCSDTATKLIRINPEFIIYIPNAFTPSNGGVNNEFRPIVSSAKDMNFSIYNRWGNEIFTSTDMYDSWNGRFAGNIVQQDVYICKTNVIDIFSKRHEYVTTITVLR